MLYLVEGYEQRPGEPKAWVGPGRRHLQGLATCLAACCGGSCCWIYRAGFCARVERPGKSDTTRIVNSTGCPATKGLARSSDSCANDTVADVEIDSRGIVGAGWM